MDEKICKLQNWLETATRGIRFGPDRAAVREELEAHLEDKTADLARIFPDMAPEEAQERALAQMGDPEELGKELARVHKPWLGYLWLASKVLIGVLCVVLIWSNLVRDHYYSTQTGFEVWDWNDLPDDIVSFAPSIHLMRHTAEEIYGRTDDPDLLFAQEYLGCQDVKVNGQTVSLRRAALWQGLGTQELFIHFRVETWRFWERGALHVPWMAVTDSLGNRYDLNRNDLKSSGTDRNRLWASEYGPFFSNYQVFLEDVDPEAEWVRLDYGPVETSFSLVVDLERA